MNKDPKLISRITDLITSFFQKPDEGKSGKLYLAAVTRLGTDVSPKDEAPDDYGCVDSLQEVYKAAFQDYITTPKTLSTKILYQTLLFNPKFERIDHPERGCIVISPTGHSTKGAPTGHCGIVGDCGIIMSNDSRNGLWLENYSVRSWITYYHDKLGFPVKFFRVK